MKKLRFQEYLPKVTQLVRSAEQWPHRPVTVLPCAAKGIKIGSGIKAADQLTLKQGGHPGL